MDVGALIREVRRRHGLDQRELARLARTSQGQVSRIERGQTSPSIATVERLLAAMGERLVLAARPVPRPNQSAAELRRAYLSTTPAERLREVADLSKVLTALAARGAARSRRP